MKLKTTISKRTKLLGVILKDPTLFLRYFWRDEITLPLSVRQKVILNDLSPRQLSVTGRKVIKTRKIEARVIQHSLTHRGGQLSERMILAPDDKQRALLRDRILTRLNGNPLFRALLADYNKNEGVIRFHNNVKWVMTIDGSDGTDKNVVGYRLDEIIRDESAFIVRAVHTSLKQSALPNCQWYLAGVPNGIRNSVLYELDQTSLGKGWSKHHMSTYANPLYQNDAGRETLHEDFKNKQDYVTQVLGQWGAELFGSFPPESIAIKPNKELSYSVTVLQEADIPQRVDPYNMAGLSARLAIPNIKEAYQFVIGMDYGSMQDPTEIGMAYRKGEQDKVWHLFKRIEILGADTVAQAKLLRYLPFILGVNKLGKVCIDLQAGGKGVGDQLLDPEKRDADFWREHIISFNAGGTIDEPDPIDRNVVKRIRRKQHFTEILKAAFIAARHNLAAQTALWIGQDEEMIEELIGTSEQRRESGYIVYLAPRKGRRAVLDHRTDMLRALACAMVETQGEEVQPDDEAVMLEMFTYSEKSPLYPTRRELPHLPVYPGLGL